MLPLAARTAQFDSSGIRKVFDLAAKMADPINLSIGQPDFPVPITVKEAAIEAINSDRNGYSQTQGIKPLLEKIEQQVHAKYPGQERKVLVTSGTSGALVLAIMGLVDPGDEVIVFDPYFVMYPALVALAGGKAVYVDTYPDFRIDLDKVAAAITPRTKLILFNSPANPTGIVATAEETRGLGALAAKHNIALLSDEIYRLFCDANALPSPAENNPDTIVVDGFSKSHAMTGWRLGWMHGPAHIIEKLTMLQQYTFVCAPHPLQWAAVAALDVDMAAHSADYRRRCNMVTTGLRDAGYEVAPARGAFYVFPKVPAGLGTGHEFVARAVENELLIIPGGIFSRRDTHFRISYAASDATIARGLKVLRKLNK